VNSHPFRWRGLAFGLVFLAVAGSWAVWEQDLLTRQQFSLTTSAVLIALGTVGVVATFWRPRSRSTQPLTTTPATDPIEEHHEQAADPHP
jgi:uncharacterized membrane protein YqjE